MPARKPTTVESTIGKVALDTEGAAVAGVRMDVGKAYADVPALLQSHINDPHSDAWKTIRAKIDYVYANLDYVFVSLDEETGFARSVQAQVKDGKKLLFKPNLVVPHTIDPVTHGPGGGDTTCTEWAFIAALMRWFHDKLNVEYGEMAVGDAASSTSGTAGFFTLHYGNGRKITNEAVLEGRSGDFYGGWGFYFARKYLAEAHPVGHNDNPMNGYEESMAGEYIPPGRTGNRLMVYDLNRINGPTKGRTVRVPGGVNFKEVTLHKVIIGGNKDDPADTKDYPGCVLVNVPKFKIHAQDLLTNAVKNLGIGLYPQECPPDGRYRSTRWKYAYPFKKNPGMKTEIPHQVWVSVMGDSMLPERAANGKYKVKKTFGFPGTQADVIRAAQSQGIYMLHVVDAIEAINLSHTGMGMGVRVNEGFVWASLDCVALDTFGARYVFNTAPMAEGRALAKKNNWPTEFMHKVPVAKVEGNNIVTGEDLDSPLFRYGLYAYCEKRGVGTQKYHVTGIDALADLPLASVAGHLGTVDNGKFAEVMEKELWYNPASFLWDMQKTVLSYAQAHDALTGSTLYRDFMAAFDENGDGVIDYNEHGTKGHWLPLMRMGSYSVHLRAMEKYGFLRGTFMSRAYGLKYSNEKWNAQGHDFMKEYRWVAAAALAFQISRMPMDVPDVFNPKMTAGNGKWPSWQMVNFFMTNTAIYGLGFPMRIDVMSMYSYPFQYADKTQNGAAYTGNGVVANDLECVNKYVQNVREGADALDFVLYVPVGFGRMGLQSVPNVEETDDPAKIFTASFNSGKEVWTPEG